MDKKIVGAALGLAVLAVSSLASAHVNLAVGVGVPVGVYAPAPPVYVAPPVAYGPAPVAVAYGGYRPYGDRSAWRERREWREREWRREHWREQQWREHGRWGY